MLDIEVALLVGAVVTVSTIVAIGSWLQAKRIRDHGRAGLSPTAWVAMLTVLPLWLAYGLRVNDAGVVASNAVLIIPTAAVVVAWGRAAGRRWTSWPCVLLWVLTVAGAAAIIPLSLVGAAAIGLDLGTTWPQAYRAVRSRDLDGISLAAWAFRGATLLLWLVYGMYMGLTHLAVAAASKLAASAVVVVLVILRRPPKLPIASP